MTTKSPASQQTDFRLMDALLIHHGSFTCPQLASLIHSKIGKARQLTSSFNQSYIEATGKAAYKAKTVGHFGLNTGDRFFVPLDGYSPIHLKPYKNLSIEETAKQLIDIHCIVYGLQVCALSDKGKAGRIAEIYSPYEHFDRFYPYLAYAECIVLSQGSVKSRDISDFFSIENHQKTTRMLREYNNRRKENNQGVLIFDDARTSYIPSNDWEPSFVRSSESADISKMHEALTKAQILDVIGW
ncbi:hypothetical protein [Vibrio alginolyticus]|uniref:hypothetical protein n=1 Tax=Vibrio alginolyticus TaxID=663 RepID=UPI0006CA7A61|nr:hypothetical protein [Vibrio alginolyticus]KPM97462.1 hypothetical protein AOG25_13395 [Vibrio alginolyticus]CAH7185801.1 conserved hypothetical protein [Vibrio chagasii]CAH7354824.1 conserved hypothetical protein [Vibrio chagasii]